MTINNHKKSIQIPVDVLFKIYPDTCRRVLSKIPFKSRRLKFWTINCVNGRSTVWMDDQLCEWLCNRVNGWSTVWMDDQLFEWTINCEDGWSTVRMDDQLWGWTINCVNGRSTVRMDNQLCEWMIDYIKKFQIKKVYQQAGQ